MRFGAGLVLVALVLAANPALAERRDANRALRGVGSLNEPSEIVAAEIAFARMVREKGEMAAFRATADANAHMFVPQRVEAQPWLKGRADPAVPVQWQSHQVWMACDGSAALSAGAWQRAPASGYFLTIWQRQPKGGYKWLLDMGAALAKPLPAPDMISASVADCPHGPKDAAKIAARAAPTPEDVAAKAAKQPTSFDRGERGRSGDGSLYWESHVQPDGTAKLDAWIFKDGEVQAVDLGAFVSRR